VSKVRICFLGTPEFALVSLKELAADEHFEIVGVVTQPDRPAGRKMQLSPSPVKVFSISHHIPVISPDSVKQDLILEHIAKWGAEIAVVVAFGQILPQKFLDLFPFGAVNVHGSLLPRWRGAAPIQRAIEAGDQESGVSLQKIVKELDAGDIIGTRRLALDENITAKELHDKLAVLGAELLKVELMDFIRGNLAPIPQDSQFVTHAKKITKTESEIDWSQSAKSIHNKIRALTMGPGTWTSFQAKKIKIHRSQIAATKSSGQPGEIVQAQGDNLTLATGSGDLQILELQPESRNRMSATDFLKAQMIKKGDILGAR
jgi:methionyl-tRNA formyltransferase